MNSLGQRPWTVGRPRIEFGSDLGPSDGNFDLGRPRISLRRPQIELGGDLGPSDGDFDLGWPRIVLRRPQIELGGDLGPSDGDFDLGWPRAREVRDVKYFRFKVFFYFLCLLFVCRARARAGLCGRRLCVFAAGVFVSAISLIYCCRSMYCCRRPISPIYCCRRPISPIYCCRRRDRRTVIFKLGTTSTTIFYLGAASVRPSDGNFQAWDDLDNDFRPRSGLGATVGR